MCGSKIIYLLILYVVHSASECVFQSNKTESINSSFANCSGVSPNSFIPLEPTWEHVVVTNRRGSAFMVKKSGTPNLNVIKTLDLSKAGTLVISRYGFRDFTSLTSLILTNGSLATINRHWFLPSNNITNLNFSWNKLRRLFKSDFENLKNLVHADFSHNRLEVIEPYTFSQMYMRELKLDNNRLKSIVIGPMPMLRMISLNNNLVDIIPVNAFTEMPHILAIRMESNRVRKIEDGAFSGLDRLGVLKLADNCIEGITNNTFSGLSRAILMTLDLSRNKIRQITPGAFQQFRFCQFLFFSQNLITELNEKSFEGLKHITALFLNDNEIETIGNNTFGGLQGLKVLLLFNNKLRSLNAGIFGKNSSQLSTFSVSNNSIEHIDPTFFEAIPNVTELFMVSNQISYLPENVFTPLTKLRVLQIQYNFIEELTSCLIESLDSVVALSIDHNRLTYIPLNSDSFPNLRWATVGGNPWQCYCLDEVVNFLESNNVTYNNKYYFDGQCPVCVPTYYEHCKRNMTFVRRTRIADTYDSYDAEKCRTKSLEEDTEIMFHVVGNIGNIFRFLSIMY